MDEQQKLNIMKVALSDALSLYYDESVDVGVTDSKMLVLRYNIVAAALHVLNATTVDEAFQFFMQDEFVYSAASQEIVFKAIMYIFGDK